MFLLGATMRKKYLPLVTVKSSGIYFMEGGLHINIAQIQFKLSDSVIRLDIFVSFVLFSTGAGSPVSSMHCLCVVVSGRFFHTL